MIKSLAFIVKIMKPLWGFVFLSVLMILLMAIVTLPYPLLNKLAIDNFVPSRDIFMLVLFSALAFSTRAIASAFQVFQNFVVRRVMAGFGHEARKSMVWKMLNAAYSQYTKGDIEAFISRISIDVAKSEELVFDIIRFLIRPIATIAVMSIIMIAYNWQIWLLILVTSSFTLSLALFLRGSLVRMEEEILSMRQGMQASITDVIENIRTIRCFGKELVYKDKMKTEIGKYGEINVAFAVKMRIIQVLIGFLVFLPVLATTIFGGYKYQTGVIEIGEWMMFMAFLELMRTPILQIGLLISRLGAQFVSTKRIIEVCEIEEENTIEKTLSDNQSDLAIEVKDMSFSYNKEKQLFQDFNLTVKKGERIAIVGPSGGGKTSFINLLLGLHKSDEGDIFYGQDNIKEISLQKLRETIGVVYQDTLLFDGDVKYNLSFDSGKHTDEELWAALDLAMARDFVKASPKKLETIVGIKGMKLSGGQRQRLAIARILLKNPPILLLDEATASLDSLTEQKIQKALESLFKNRTSICIAHRLSTIINSDRIVYIDNGKIIEAGPHKELLKNKGAYYNLYKTQVNGML